MKRTAAEHARRNMIKRNRAVTSSEATKVASEPVVEPAVKEDLTTEKSTTSTKKKKRN